MTRIADTHPSGHNYICGTSGRLPLKWTEREAADQAKVKATQIMKWIFSNAKILSTQILLPGFEAQQSLPLWPNYVLKHKAVDEWVTITEEKWYQKNSFTSEPNFISSRVIVSGSGLFLYHPARPPNPNGQASEHFTSWSLLNCSNSFANHFHKKVSNSAFVG